MSISVVTALNAGKDHLRDDQTTGDAKFIAYTDQTSKLWEVRPIYDRFASPRRNSRIHKLQIHQYVDTEYSIWMDANLALRVPPEQIVSEWLKDYDIAVFKHPERDCIYDEAMICATHRLDDPEIIIEQAVKYEKAGFTKKRGLAECNVIVRRHTPKIEAFNNAWWSEYCRHSVRDQISFMYVADKLGMRVNYITPCARWGHPYFHFMNHLTQRNEQSPV